MRIVRWLGGVALAAAVAIGSWLALVQAAPDDVVWKVTTPSRHLTAGQKTSLASVVTCIAPAVPVAQLHDWRVALEPVKDSDPVWRFAGSGVRSMTDAAYVAALVAGEVGPYQSRAGGLVTVPARVTGDVPSTCVDDVEAWAAAVWGIPAPSLQGWYVARNPAAPSVVDGEAIYLVTGGPAAYLDAGGGVVGGPELVGVVE